LKENKDEFRAKAEDGDEDFVALIREMEDREDLAVALKGYK